jgi:hypothetical protein
MWTFWKATPTYEKMASFDDAILYANSQSETPTQRESMRL